MHTPLDLQLWCTYWTEYFFQWLSTYNWYWDKMTQFYLESESMVFGMGWWAVGKSTHICVFSDRGFVGDEKQCRSALPTKYHRLLRCQVVFYKKTILYFVRKWVIRIWPFGFCHNLSLSSVPIYFFEFHQNLSIWVFAANWAFAFCCYLSFVTI